MKISAFTTGYRAPSSRFRVRQLIDPLKKYDVEVKEFTSVNGAFPPVNRIKRPFWGGKEIISRFGQINKISNECELVWIQKPFISKFPTIEHIIKQPKVFDVDDAIHLTNEKFLTKLAPKMNAIICGNDYLASIYSEYNKNIYVIPTAVDTQRFLPREGCDKNSKFTIGWSGTSGGFKYLYQIEDALQKFLETHDNSVLRIVSNEPPKFKKISDKNIEFFYWSEKSEVSLIQTMDVGLMPLNNTEFEKGKCSYKMLLYMSCQVPVIVSPIGMNAQIFEKYGDSGFLATTTEEWIQSMNILYEKKEKRVEFGMTGRIIIEQYFDVGVVSEKLNDTFKDILKTTVSRKV